MTGDGEGETGTFPDCAGYGDRTPVKFGQLTNDGESQTVTGDGISLTLAIGDMGFEDPGKKGCDDTVAVVCDPDVNIIFVGTELYSDRRASGGVFQCIDQ